MSTIYRRYKTILGYIKLVCKVAHRPGGVEALANQLEELDQRWSGTGLTRPCPSCGSTDLEPTGPKPSSEGASFTRLRCKACGQEFDQPVSGS